MLETIRPELDEMSFREYLMADEMTMSYNAKWGAQYHFPEKSGRIGMLTYCNNLSVKDYCDLRTSVGWPFISDDQAQSGLDNSDFIISCVDEGKTVGCARIFWDKGYIAYLADVIVNPEYQGQGIGKKMVQECIKYIDNQLKEGWRIKIVIVASKGKEAFYEKLGFKARPNDNDGPGMDMWRE